MHRPEISELIEFLRFPSVSTQHHHVGDMKLCAEWLHNRLMQAGLASRIEPTAGAPAVIASTPRDPARRTVLVYGHYDVQPPEPIEAWTTPPFEPDLRDGRIFARGATDNKGQILAHILGVEQLLRNGPPPVNIIFLIEGEEEIGSPNLALLLQRLKGELACDVIVISDTGMVAHGHPTLTYALRGVAAMEVTVTGPSHDLHSGVFGGAIMNPATALCKIVASLHDASGRVAVEGFYETVESLHEWEREAAASLPTSDAALLELTGAPSVFGEEGFSSTERIGARPTIEVNGLGSGYQGEGTKTVLPASAFAKLTFRLVPDQHSGEILDLVRDHIERHCPPGVNLKISCGHSGEPYFCDPHSRFGEAALHALERVFAKSPALLREGGSIPILCDFKRILGANSLLLALASPDCRAHSPNENFPIENFEAGIRLGRAIMEEIGALSP